MHKILALIAFVLSLATVESRPISSGWISEHGVSIVAISQNEGPYLKEWIDYHLKIGVEHFWIYTNNCTDNTNEVLEPYRKKGIVEVINWPSEQQENDWWHFTFETQPWAYNDCLKRCKDRTKWLAVIDTDEFLVTRGGVDIFTLLERYYPNEVGIFLNWQCFGHNNKNALSHNGHKYILRQLTSKMRSDHPWNQNGKLIVRPKFVNSFWYPHDCYFEEGLSSVNTHHEPHPRGCSAIYLDVLYLNHYWARDLWFFENVKIPRYGRWNDTKVEECLRRESEMHDEEDTTIIRTLDRRK